MRFVCVFWTNRQFENCWLVMMMSSMGVRLRLDGFDVCHFEILAFCLMCSGGGGG